MHLCKIMVGAFMYGWPRFDDRGREQYDDGNLANGEQFALDLMSEGYVVEPMDGFDLKAFAKWCVDQRTKAA